MSRNIWFCIVVFLANVIQGITGFAGTILAMPPAMLLVGYPVAKPVLNVLGLLAGILVFARGYQFCSWGEVKRMLLFMVPGLFAGMAVKGFVAGREQYLTLLLGVFVLCLSIQGAVRLFFEGRKNAAGNETPGGLGQAGDAVLLLAAGLVHGIFVSGGPLLIGYLTRRIKEKENFRVTISVMWILLNGMLLVDDMAEGYWDVNLLCILGMVLIPFLAGMYLGGKLCSRLSRRMFMIITYMLLFAAGMTLLFR